MLFRDGVRAFSGAMKSSITQLIFLALLTGFVPSQLLAAEYSAFGPRVYERLKGAPRVETDTFTAIRPGTEFTLRIQNGGLAAGTQYSRVSSAVILFNGQPILHPRDLNQKVAFIEKVVTLQAVNEISVEVRSKPGSALIIGIYGNNEIPQASAQQLTLNEDETHAFVLSGSDLDGDALSYQIVDQPAHGVLSGVAPNLSYTPNENFNGADSFTFKVNDGLADSVPASVNINVLPVNDAPLARVQNLSTNEDAAFNIVLSGSDIDGDTLSYRLTTQPASGVLSGIAPNFSYTPDANFYGSDSFSFVVSDGILDSADASISITINAVNDAPVANNISAKTDEDIAVGIVLSGIDIESDALTYQLVNQPLQGEVSGTFPHAVYTPDVGYFGSDSFTYLANDGQLNSAPATVSIEVIEREKPPVIQSTAITVSHEYQAYSYDVHATDKNAGDVLAYSLVQNPASASIDALSGVVSWMPDSKYVSGLQSDNHLCSVTSYDENYRSLDLVFVNDVSGSPVFTDLLLNDLVVATEQTAIDSKIGSVTQPNQYGLLNFSTTASPVSVNNALMYPAADYPLASQQVVAAPVAESDALSALSNLIQQYPLRANVSKQLVLGTTNIPVTFDSLIFNQLLSDLQSKNISLSVVVDAAMRCDNGSTAWGIDANNIGYSLVNGVISQCANPVISNAAPTVLSSYIELAKKTGGSIWSAAQLVNATDFKTVFSHQFSENLAKSFTVNQVDLTVQKIELNPLDPTAATVTVKNRGLAPANQTVTLSVEGVSEAAPSVLLESIALVDIPAAATRSVPVTLPANHNYTALTASVSALSQTQECVINNNQLSAPLFSVKVADQTGLSDRQTYVVNVYETNDAPFIISDPVSSAFIGEAYSYRVVSTDSDIGDMARYSLLNSPQGMWVHPITGLISWTPQLADQGEHIIDIQVTDIEGRVAFQNYLLSVGAFNHAPEIITKPVTSVSLHELYYYDVNATDLDSDFLSYSLLTSPAGSFIDATTGVITWRPVAEGIVDFAVQVSDGKGGFDTQQFSVEVFNTYINQAPTALPANYQTAQNQSLNIVLSAEDINGDVLSYRVTRQPLNGTLYGSGATLQYLPNSYFSGSDSFEFSVNDGQLNSNPAIITIDTADSNNPPQIISEPVRKFQLGTELGAAVPVDLTQWTTINYGDGRLWNGDGYWHIDPDDPTVVTQMNNSGSTIFLSDFASTNNQIKGTFRTFDTVDNDFMGFVFGYQNIGQFYLFDWKMEPQTSALRGMSVKLVNSPNAKPAGFWTTFSTQYETLYHNDIGWARHTDYEFTLTFNPGEFTITIHQGTTVVDSFTVQDSTYTSGGFGFYNQSQPQVVYTGFTEETISTKVYRYQVETVDPDGDAVTLSLLKAPAGMSLDQNTGLLSWVATVDEVGVHEVSIQVTDTSGATDIQNFSILVSDEVPVISTEPVVTAHVDQRYIYDVHAYDPNPDDVLSFSLVQNPVGMSIDAVSGLISWQPGIADIGIHPVTVRVTDASGLFSEQTFNLDTQLLPDNTAPVFTTTPGLTAQVGVPYVYIPQAYDADGDTFTISMLTIPYGMERVSAQQITWIPTAEQVTQHSVIIDVNDGKGGITTQEFVIDVIGATANAAPSITSTPGQLVQLNTQYEYQVIATDPEADVLSYQLTTAPLGMSIDATGAIIWTPTETGFYNVVVKVEDSLGGYATQSFEIAVLTTLTNAAPEISSLPITSAYLENRYEYQIVASDIDGDALVYSVVTGPQGLSVDPYAGLVSWVPQSNQLGAHEVSLKASDGRGGSLLQTYTLTILPVSNNQAPIISTTPITLATPAVSYNYQLIATDNDGDALSYTLDSAPAGMTISPTGLVSWAPTLGQASLNTVAISVNDGRGGITTQSYTLALDDGSGAVGNGAPLITSAPIVETAPLINYAYQVVALDAEAGALSYTLTQSPTSMRISASGLISWLPLEADIGLHNVALQVSDAQGNFAEQSFALSVIAQGANQAPVISSTPSNLAKVGLTYSYQLLASDANADSLSYRVSSPLNDAVISSSGLLSWTPTVSGTQTLSVTASDGIASVSQSWLVNVSAAGTLLSADILMNPDVVDLGGSVNVQVEVSGAAGETSSAIAVDGVDYALDANNRAVITLATIGAHEVVARVSDGYDTAQSRKSFYIRDPSDTTAPVASILNIEEGQTITELTDVIADIQDDNLAEWTLSLQSKSAPENLTTIASGGLSVAQTNIGSIDPGVLTNGQYRLVLEALDNSRNTTLDSRVILIDGDLKVGNFSFTVTDLDIPLAGIPIQVNRTYDSRRRQENLDFGYGWSIDYQNVKVEESRKITRDWTINEYRSGLMNAYVDLCVEPIGTPIVTITLPNGDVEQFEVSATPQCSFYFVTKDVELKFNPVGSTLSTLKQTQHAGILRIEGGYLVDTGTFTVPEIDLYELTTQSGFIYKLDQNFGIREVIDPNGHTLTYTDKGIFHSSGKSVLFERNAHGQIDAIIDPSGQRYTYQRDANGDLTAMIDPVVAASNLANNTTLTTNSYTYNRNHGLLDMYDALGRKLLKNIYDNTGRLIAQEDGEGNRTEFNHDLSGKTSVITNRRGFATQYQYDARGNVLTEINALNQKTRYTYDADDNQLTKTDALLNTTSATYDTRRNQLTQTDALGNTVSFTYNTRGQELTVTDAKNNTFNNVYDPFGNLLSIEDPQGNIAGNNINKQGLPSLVRNALGHETTFTYDDEGNKLTETDALLNVTTFTYDTNNNVLTESRTRQVNGLSTVETTTYTYDAQNRLRTTTDALGQVSEQVYDLVGNKVKDINELGHETVYTYDAYRRLTRTDYHDGTFATKTYDAEGNLTSDTDRTGFVTSYAYDALNRLTTTTYGDPLVNIQTQIEYDAAGRVTAEIDENNNRTEFAYDAAGRRTLTRDALLNETTFDYDEEGNLISQTDANLNTTRFEYDALDNRVKTIYPDLSTSTQEYDAMGQVTRRTDQAGKVTNYAYDELGRLKEVTDALLGKTTYSYDEVGNKLTQTDAENRATSWTYDALGRETSRTLPLGQSDSTTYINTPTGKQTTRTDFNGQVTVFKNDSNGRVELITYNDATTESFAYDNEGRRTSAVDRQGNTQSWAYDNRGRLISDTKANGDQIAYGYDKAGNRTSLKVTPLNGTAETTNYGFDTLNRLETVTAAGNQLTTYTYDKVGNRASVTYPNGNITSYIYDDLNRLTQQTTTQGLTVLTDYNYTLDASGHRTKITEASGRVTDYTYDDLYRLLTENITDTTNGNYSASYQYDKVGNRIYSTVDGVQTLFTYDDNDRLSQQGGTTYTYDANGNTLTETLDLNTKTFSYDAKNQMVGSEQGGVSSTYGYDIDGLRSSKTEDTITTQFLVDLNRDYGQVIKETSPTSMVDYIYGDDLISQSRGSSLSYYIYDGLGSTRALSDVSGVVSDRYDYEAFGDTLNKTGTTPNSYLYTGEQYDSNLDNYYLRARYYNQNSGRFTQMDTYMGSNQDPVTLHKYLYANVDPINNIDPSGNFSIGSVMSAVNTVGTLSTIAQASYSVFQIATGEQEMPTAREAGTAILMSLIFRGATSANMIKKFKNFKGMMSKKSIKEIESSCFDNSFVGGTFVYTKNGLKPIDEIKIGDFVLSYNEVTDKSEYKAVTHLIQNEKNDDFVILKFGDDKYIESTSDHPYFVKGEWKDAISLLSGYELKGIDGLVLIDSLSTKKGSQKVYNITVDGNHNYYVGEDSVLVHNAKPCPFFVLPKTVRSASGVAGNFSIKGYSFRIDTNRISANEGFHIHIYKGRTEIAKVTARGGWLPMHGGKPLPAKPSTVPSIIRQEINKLVKHVNRN